MEFLDERTRLGRAWATIVVGSLIWSLGNAALLSFNVWSDPLPIVGLGVFDFLDVLTSQYMLPLNGLLVVIFVGWMLDRHGALKELGLSGRAARVWGILMRVIAPLGVTAVFVAGLVG